MLLEEEKGEGTQGGVETTDRSRTASGSGCVDVHVTVKDAHLNDTEHAWAHEARPVLKRPELGEGERQRVIQQQGVWAPSHALGLNLSRISDPSPEELEDTPVPAPGDADDAFVEMLKGIAQLNASEITSEDQGVEIAFEDIRFAINVKGGDGKESEKVIVHPFSGCIPAGSLVAIMGPSGCGKTTFMDMIADKKTTPYTGSVYVNGCQRSPQFKRLTSYVPQFDYGNGLETVWESIEFVSRMKADYGSFGGDETEKRRAEHIGKVIAVLGLRKVKDTRVGNELVRGISGGQKRRVTLAKGLITGPYLLFADEPTSGLSSTDTEIVMNALRNVCTYVKMTVICVIHQPKLSVFNMFDKLILLSEGQCVYQGDPKLVPEYFSELGYPVPPMTNPADWILDCVTPGAKGANPELFVNEYATRQAPSHERALQEAKNKSGKSDKEILADPRTTRGQKEFMLPWYSQTGLVMGRSLRLLSRDIDTLTTMIGSQLLVGILIGLVYLGVFSKNPRTVQFEFGFLFILIVSAGFAALADVPVLVQERVIFQNERAEGLYNTFPYLMGRMLQSLSIAILSVFLLCVTSYFMADGPKASFLLVYVSCLTTYLVVAALMGICSSISKTAIQANSTASVSLTFLSLFNGFTSNTLTSPVWISWVCYISPFYYAFWGITSDLYSADDIRDLFGFPQAFVWQAVGVNLGFAALFHLIQFYLLHFKSTLVK